MKKGTFKKILLKIIIVATFLIFYGLISKSNAAELIGIWDVSADDGKSNVTASLYKDGKLIISGNGDMNSYDKSSNQPYYNLKEFIKTIEIEDGITSIGNDAFSYSSNLKSIKFSNSLTNIGTSAFFKCTKLSNIKIPDTVTNIGNNAFMYCYSISSIRLPIGITTINNYSFACSGIKKIDIPDTVISIGNNAFFNCAKLYNIEIPNSIRNIGANAFDGCIKIESIEIPEGVETIGDDAFINCSNLNNINIALNNKNFCDIDGVLYNKEKNNLIRCPQTKENIDIPDSVTNIARKAFYGCTNIANIQIPNEVTIGNEAFKNAKMILVANDGSLNVNLPNTISRAITNSEDVLYANNNYELTNCELINNSILVNDVIGKKTLKINEGALSGLEVIIKKSINIKGDVYIVNDDTENKTKKEIEWITISSDRNEGSRLFLEFDIDLIKEYNSQNGVISYSTLKTWINKLEEAYDYFLELNPCPSTPKLIIEWTGISSQVASAYASEKIVMNKEYHKGTLAKMEVGSQKGIINISGTVLHEMGHEFAGCTKFLETNYWNVGVEYINLIMVQYVLDKLAANNDNIYAIVNPYNDYILASQNVESIILDRTNDEEDASDEELIKKYILNIDKNDPNFEKYKIPILLDNYAQCWVNIKNQTSYENEGDASYVDTLVNFTQIFDKIGKEKMKQVFNKYVNDTDEIIEDYNTSNDYNIFLTMMEIIKKFVTADEWNSIHENYENLYKKFVVDITLNHPEIVIKEGESRKINFISSYNSDIHDDFIPEFSSKNENIATVDCDGIISAKTEGNTKVRVKVGNEYALVSVEVLNNSENALDVETERYVFYGLESKKIDIYTIPYNLADNLEWISSDQSIANVDQNGIVTPQKSGLCTITVKTTDGTNLIAKIDIEVQVPIEEERIEIKSNPNKTVYKKGEELDLSGGKVSLIYSYGYKATFNMDSDNITIEGYDPNKSGKQTITIKYNGKETTFSVEVKGIPVSDVVLNGSETVEVGKSIKLVCTIQPSDAENKNVTWESSDTNIATVDSEGNVTGITNGKVTITVTTEDGGKKASKNINVKTTVTGVELDKTTMSLIKGESEELGVIIKPETASNKNIIITSSDQNVATVNIDSETKKIIVTGVEDGTAKIIITTKEGNYKAECLVTVHNNVASIEVSKMPEKTTYIKGEEIDLSGIEITATYEDETTRVIELSADKFTGYDANELGEQEITVTYAEGITAKFNVIVVEKKLTEIKITNPPSKIEYIEGEPFERAGMVVVAVYNDNSEEEITDYIIDEEGEEGVSIQGNSYPYNSSVRVKYTEAGVSKGVNQPITVRAKAVETIKVKEDTIQKTYVKGTELNLTGGKLEVKYNNNKTEEIDMTAEGVEVKGYDNTQLGEQILTVKYKGKETTFSVEVESNKLMEIEITNPPHKTEYIEGENFDPEGMRITAVYNDNSERSVLDFVVVNGTDLKMHGNEGENNSSVLIQYTENEITKSVIQYITVREKAVETIKVKEDTIQKTYVKGTELDKTGGKLEVKYNNNKTEEIDMTAEGVEVIGYNANELGEQTITVKYREKETTFEVTVKNDISTIEVKEESMETTYVKGTELDKTGGKLEITYENGEKEEIDMTAEGVEVAGYDANELGKQTLTVKYKGKETTFNVIVVEKKLTEIKITNPPSKLEYIEGEPFERAGMIVVAVYNDNSEEEITDYTIDEEGEKGVSIQGNSYPYNSSVRVKYTEAGVTKGVSQPITVSAKVVETIKVKKGSMETTYVKGTELDKTGGKLEVKYNNNKTEEIDMTAEGVEVTGYNANELGEQIITVKYREKETTFEVTVKNDIVTIEVKEGSMETTYVIGTELDKTGGKLEITYENGETEEIDMTAEGVEVTGYNPNELGEQEITVTYKEGITTKFKVIVVEKKLAEIKITNPPSKIEYVEGEPFERAGMIVVAVYNDNSEEEITDYIIDEEGEEGVSIQEDAYPYNSSVRVKYTEAGVTKGVSQPITVSAKVVETIKVKKGSMETTYVKGTELDKTGGKLEVKYNNNKTEEIDMTAEGVEVIGYNANELGEQTITVKYREKETTFEVTVKNDISTIEVKEESMETTYVKGTELDKTGGKLEITYENGEKEEIDMTAEGVEVTGYNANQIGEQILTVKYKGKETTFNVEVIGVQVSSVILNGGETVEVGKSIKLICTVEPSNAENKNVTWESSDTNIATVDSEGNVTGVLNGTVTITVTTEDGGKTASKNINVETPVTGVELDKTTMSLVKGESEELGIIIKPETASNKNITLTSSDENIVTLNLEETTNKIIVTGRNEGEATIIVKTKDGDYKAECVVTVHNNITSIAVTKMPEKTTYIKGEEIDLSGVEITATYEDGTTRVIELSADKFTGYDANKEGKQEITVTYVEGITTKFNVIVVENKLTEIIISNPPYKIEYIEGENFEKDGMIIEAVYSDETRKEVTNYEVQNGENLVKGQDTITIIYTEGGMTKSVDLKITVKEKLVVKAEQYELKEADGDKYLKNIKPKTTIENFKDMIITNGTVKVFMNNQEVTDNSAIIKTGTKITIEYLNQKIEYTAVVTGDLTGDGEIDIVDMLKLSRYIAKLDQNIKGAYLEAADIYKDGVCANNLDLLKLSRVLAKIDELQ